MTIQGSIERGGGISDHFELPDPRPGEMTSARVQIKPNVWRHLLWGKDHMISTGGGAGKLYLKHARVGQPIDTANLPRIGSSGTLTDAETGVVIKVSRTR